MEFSCSKVTGRHVLSTTRWELVTFFQKHWNCSIETSLNCDEDPWNLSLTEFRFTNDVTSRYTPVEREVLALVYGLEFCRIFLLGCLNLLLAMDHKSLMNIFSGHVLEKMKITRFLKEPLLMYRFQIELNGALDCTSRYPGFVSYIKTTVSDKAQLSEWLRGVMVKAMDSGTVVKRVRTPVALLRSLLGKYHWERYEPPYPPRYGYIVPPLFF